MNLNKYQSTYIDQPGMYVVTITESKNDYTRSGKECVFVRFETDKNQAITCSYVEAVFFKRSAQGNFGLCVFQTRSYPVLLH